MDSNDFDKILLKRAKGYTKKESVTEYVRDNESGELILSKKKISTKHIPPDINAIKLLAYGNNDGNAFEGICDEELLSMLETIKSQENIE